MVRRGDTVLQFRCLEHLNAPTVSFLDAKNEQVVVACSKCERPIAYAYLHSIPALIA